MFSIVIIWSSIKYVPSYLSENSILKKEKEDYQFFYKYVFLNQFKNSKTTSVDLVLKKIQQKDTVLIKEYKLLYDTYQNEIRKIQIKKELKSLEKP